MTLRNRLLLLLAICLPFLLGAQNVKTINGVPIANVKTVAGVAKASVKSIAGVDNTSGGGGFTWPSNLVSYLRFDEAGGNNRVDQLSAVTLVETSGTIDAATGLVYANAADFEAGDTEHLFDNGGAAEWFSPTAWTVCMWIKPESLTAFDTFFSSQNSNTPALLYASSSVVRLNLNGALGQLGQHDESFAMSPGNWYFVCARWNDAGDAANISINGAAWGADTTNTNSFNTSANTLVIGAAGAGNFNTDGIIGPVMFFSKALNDTEVSDLYNGGAGRVYP